jgi:hypothetical protein
MYICWRSCDGRWAEGGSRKEGGAGPTIKLPVFRFHRLDGCEDASVFGDIEFQDFNGGLDAELFQLLNGLDAGLWGAAAEEVGCCGEAEGYGLEDCEAQGAVCSCAEYYLCWER